MEEYPSEPEFLVTEILPEPQKPPFHAVPAEGLAALLMFPAAYLYIKLFDLDDIGHLGLCLAAVAVLLIVITELIHYKNRWAAESWVWLACFLLPVISLVFDIGTVWINGEPFLFLHIFFIWWVLSRSGKLLEGKSGHLLPLDAINVFFRVPFSRFFLRIRTLICCLKELLKGPKKGASRNFWLIPAIIACLLLFFAAAKLLTLADSAFGAAFQRFFDSLAEFWDTEFWARFLFSLPVGCWLFGMISGLNRFEQEKLDTERDNTYRLLKKLKKIPDGFWTIVIGLFSLLYIAFFVLQGSYLFGAFTRTLPDGFIVSQYAREGFFELCKVMAVNFALLWLATRMVTEAGLQRRPFQIACLLLLAESMLFAVIAFSKLALYISCFGFTPLRLQSTWLVCILFVGCVLWMVHLLTGKKLFRLWMYFGAISLSVLTVL